MVFNHKRGSVFGGFDRISMLTIVIFILVTLLVLKLFNLQIIRGDFFEALAAGRNTIYKELYPKRGEIFIEDTQLSGEQSLYPVALNVDLNEIYAVPQYIKNPKKTSELLFPLLDISQEELEVRLSKRGDPYEPLAHYVTDEKVEEVKLLEIEGIGFKPEIARFYPEKNLFSHILGFIGFSGDKRVGQYGIEGYFEEVLTGKRGEIFLEEGVLGNWISTSGRTIKQAEDGADLVLTIDRSIQYVACQELQEGVKRYGAESGSVIVLNPETGAILALCGYPNFDSNNYSLVKNISIFVNQAISGTYEPGSIFKVITMAAGLDSDLITPQTTYEDKGEVYIDGHTIQNSDLKAHGTVSMTGVLEQSLNTGAIFVAHKIGTSLFRDYLERFGFGSLTGIELSGEAMGDISSLKKQSEIYLATASFGQGISVTPIQMITAFTAIVNQGKLTKPYIVDRILKPNGEVVRTEPRVTGQTISPLTAKTLSAMLVSVVKNGHSKKAGVPGYYVAGKTGTAQVPLPQERGYSDLTIHSFVGFAPVEKPVFIALVKLDYPKAVRFAEDSATPIFGKIAKFVLNYYQVPPDY